MSDDATPCDPPAELHDAGVGPVGTCARLFCPICGGEASNDYACGYDYEILTCSNCWRFVRCEGCGHVRLHPRPALEALPVIYPPTYYAYNYEAQINPLAVFGKSLLDRLKLGGIIKRMRHAPRSYLDIGCGTGKFLRLMEKKGISRAQIYGLELDDRVVDTLADEGYRVYCRRIEECTEIPENAVDLITMFHVIEHVDDLGDVVAKMAGWLSPDGLLAMETPNLDSLDARLFKDRFWGGYHYPRHWHLFTPETIRPLLEQHGLQVVAVRYQTGHSFWMYSVHHALRYGRRPHTWLARWFHPFATRGLPFLVMFTLFDKLRAALGARTSSMLVLARKTDT